MLPSPTSGLQPENTISHHYITGRIGSGDHSETVTDQERTKPLQERKPGDQEPPCVPILDCTSGFSRMCFGKLQPADQIQPTLHSMSLVFTFVNCWEEQEKKKKQNKEHTTEPYVSVKAKILAGI